MTGTINIEANERADATIDSPLVLRPPSRFGGWGIFSCGEPQLNRAPPRRASTIGNANLTLLVLPEGRSLAALKQGFSVEETADLYQLGDHSGPARLVAGTDARAVVTVKIFVE